MPQPPRAKAKMTISEFLLVLNEIKDAFSCADNTSGGFYYEVDGSKGWIRYPHEMRQENAIQPFDFSIPPPAPYLPGSPVTVAVPESISSLDSLEDSLSSPRMSSSSNVGSCLSLNTTLDSGTVDYGWSFAVCKTGAESPAASMVRYFS